MLRSITYTQFIEWLVFAELEPFDETRADMRAAQIAAAVYNVHRKKGKAPLEARELVISFGDSPQASRKQTWQQMKMIGQAYASMYNMEEKRKRPTRGVQRPPRRKARA